jgi:hypothetical protein
MRKTSWEVAQDVCTYDDSKHQELGQPETCLPVLIRTLGAMSVSDRCDAQALKALLLRQDISEMVQAASLQVDGFLAEVDSESNHIREVKDTLTDRQNSNISRTSLGSNIGTAGGAVGSALALGANTAVTVGSWVGAVFGGFGASFGFWNYFASSRSPKGCFPSKTNSKCEYFECPNEGTADRACSPAMLFSLFPEPTPFTEPFHSDYDPIIAKYLQEKDRKRQLIENWEEDSKDKKGQIHLEIDKLTASNLKPANFPIDQLSERQNKLSDLRALVARINRDLSRFTNDLAIGLHGCASGVVQPPTDRKAPQGEMLTGPLSPVATAQ